MTGIEPPTPVVQCSAVAAIVVVIFVSGREGKVVATVRGTGAGQSQHIPSCARVTADVHPEKISLAVQPKVLVGGVVVFAGELHVDPQLTRLPAQIVDVGEAPPEVPVHVQAAEAVRVVGPVLEEAHLCRSSPLEDDPAASVSDCVADSLCAGSCHGYQLTRCRAAALTPCRNDSDVGVDDGGVGGVLVVELRVEHRALQGRRHGLPHKQAEFLLTELRAEASVLIMT